MDNQQLKLTPEQSISVLREFVNHPGVRCFNAGEYTTAYLALNCLEEAVKPAPAKNVVALPHVEKRSE